MADPFHRGKLTSCGAALPTVPAHRDLGRIEVFILTQALTEKLARTAFTQHLLRLVPEGPSAEALYAYLTTTVGFRLLRSTAVGTKLLSMRPDLLAALPVPDLNAPVGKAAGELIKRAFEARDSGDQAEAEAIRIIEQEVLPQWLA